jgi:O-antigen/teichoic acid export membrane protein
VSLAMFAFSSFTNIDSIIVKHFFSSVDTGYYSIAQNIASIALFLPSALAIVIFPKSTKAFVEGRDSPRILRKSLLLAAAFCFLFVAGVFIVPNTVLILFTGKTNPASAGLLGLLSAALSFYALTWIMINFLLAVHNLDFIVPFAVLAGLEAICVYNCHQSLMMVGYTVTIFAVLAFTMLLWSARNKVHIRQG